MVAIKEAEARNYTNMWICAKCNAKIRGSTNQKPEKCRKCKSSNLRLKKKRTKSKA